MPSMDSFTSLPPELVSMTFNYLSVADMAALRVSNKASRQLVDDHAPRQSHLAKMDLHRKTEMIERDMESFYCDASKHSNLLDSLRQWIRYHGISLRTHLEFAHVYEGHNHMRFAEEHRNSGVLPYHQRLSSMVFSLLVADAHLYKRFLRRNFQVPLKCPATYLWAPSAAYSSSATFETMIDTWADATANSVDAYQVAHSAVTDKAPGLRDIYFRREWQDLDKEGKLFGMTNAEWRAMNQSLGEQPLTGAPIEAKFEALKQMNLGEDMDDVQSEWVSHNHFENTFGLHVIAGGAWQYYPKHLSTAGLVNKWDGQPEGEEDELLRIAILEDLDLIWIGNTEGQLEDGGSE